MSNLAVTSNPVLIEKLKKDDQLLITNYGETYLFENKVLIKGSMPFPLYENLTPIGFVNIEVEKKEISKQIRKLLEEKDELEKMFAISEFMIGSRKFGTSFSDYLEIAILILDYFSDKGIEEAVFKIRERWDEYGDLLDRWFEVINYKGTDTGTDNHYSFAFVRLSDVPKKMQRLLRECNLYSDNRFIGIYEEYDDPEYTFVAVIQNYPLNLDNTKEIWRNNFEVVKKEGENLLEKFDKYLKDFFVLSSDLFSLTVKIKDLKYIEDLNILSLLRLIKVKMKLQKENKNKFGELEKTLNFKIKASNYPYKFNIEFI